MCADRTRAARRGCAPCHDNVWQRGYDCCSRLAIAVDWQGKGSRLLKDAMMRTLQAADIAGYHLFVLLEDVRLILKHW